MKTFFSFLAICFLFVESAYAEQSTSNIKEQAAKQQGNTAAYKISKRKSLKVQPVKDEEVSSFSMEELRVGAQKPLSKSEIEYFKSQCRYAFMSDRDIIINRCEVKKVSISK